ncbi:cation diffusion facilitator family transporter [Citricoccus sp. GCM10030269]|uniref:cation diffusion facilitator family transporter n=1 Tax=Citricoccus sp. GCM10030269 TaxID=3273388 RepID=UPI00361B1359
MAAGGGNKAVIAALIANLGIATLKFIAYFLTRSSAMLAEAIHSVADSGNQLLLLVGGKTAAKEADPEHPFGHGGDRYIYAFVVSIVLFSVGGLFALYEAYHKWQDPHPIEGRWWWVPIAVLVGGIALEGRSFLVAVSESKKAKGEQSWGRFIRNAKAPELPVILLEDFAALIGLVLALIAVTLTLLTGNGLWDAAGTACIGVLLVLIAVTLAVETKSLLLGESASKTDVRAIRTALEGEGDNHVIHLKTLHLGPEEILVAAKIGVQPDAGAKAVVERINDAEARIRRAVPMARLIYIEPDIEQPDYRSSVPPRVPSRKEH